MNFEQSFAMRLYGIKGFMGRLLLEMKTRFRFIKKLCAAATDYS